MTIDAAEKPAVVRRMFARISGRYDLMNTLMTLGRDRAWRRLTARIARQGGGTLALDVASGTGDLTIALAEAGFELAIGADFTPEMVAEAVRKMPTAVRVRHLVADGLRLPFADNTFDAVTTGYALRNFASIPAALAEMARVLRPGGVMAHLELTRPTWPPMGLLFRPYLGWLVPALGQLVTGDRPAYAYLPRSLATHPLPAEIAAMMRAAGVEPNPPRYLALGAVAIHSGVKR